MQILFRTVLRDRKEDPEMAQADINVPTMITFPEFMHSMVRAHLLWASPPQDSLYTDSLYQVPAGAVVDHPQRILNALKKSNNDHIALETFLYRVEGKNLKGYAKKLSPKASQQTFVPQLQNSPKNSIFADSDGASPVKIKKNLQF